VIQLVAAVVSGFTLGGTFALIALGLVFAFRATRTFNFAHGELMALPAFIVGYGQASHHPTWAFLAIALGASAVIGGGFYLLVLRRTTGMPFFMGIIATFGLAAILDGVMSIWFGANDYSIALTALPSGRVQIFGATVSSLSLTLAALTVILAIAVALIARFTPLGVKIRAAGQDPVLASQCGVRVSRLFLGSWMIAGLLAAIAGISYGSVQVVNTSFVSLALSAIPAMVIGGMDSIAGAVIGGIVIGMIQSFTQIYLGGNYVTLVTYCLLLVVLLIYPQGLFGTKEIVRA
jgi:branched-chain amino acid transport system permease protein